MNVVQKQDGNTVSEWEVIKIKRIFKLIGGDREVEVEGLKRNDGFMVDNIKASRNGATETFVCTGGFGKFSFTASRWDSLKEKPLDTYKVFLNVYIKEPDLSLCKAHAKDVESALLHFPISRHFKGVPVKKVIFETGEVRNPNYLRAEEI